MKYKIYVDGQQGTTGLKIIERLENHPGVDLMRIDPDKRHDVAARKEMLNGCDLAFLCLPDDAARQAVSLIENKHTVVIDASTAHRTDPDWAYGLPELGDSFLEKIKNSKWIAVPGCHATGFATTVYPLVKSGLLPADYPVSAHSVTGYSGGGKSMIADYEGQRTAGDKRESPAFYALSLTHKHLKEMTAICGLSYPPVFTPIVGDFYQGMTVAVPLTNRLLAGRPDARQLHHFFEDYYKGQRFVRVMPFDIQDSLDSGFLYATDCNGTNRIDLFVCGHTDQTVVLCRLDNLGKGSSGAAIQCMNLVLGFEQDQGL